MSVVEEEGRVTVGSPPRGAAASAAAGTARESTLAAALGALERGSGDVDIGGSFVLKVS